MKTLEQIAKENNLELIESVEGANNGYPRNFKQAIIGFENWQQVEEIAKKYNLDIISFHKRSGWNFWERSNFMDEPYKITSSSYGDDYSEFTLADVDTFFENEVEFALGDFDNLEDLYKFVCTKKALLDKIKELDEDEILIAECGEYYETIKKEMIEWDFDTHLYVIGVIRIL